MLFTLYDFVWIFANVLAVFVLSFIRLFAFGISTLIKFGRMDSSFLTLKFSDLDFGYSSYVGMLLIDHDHNNPILLVWADILTHELTLQRAKKTAHSAQTDTSPLIPFFSSEKHLIGRKYNNRIVNKWWLFVTLHNNPELTEFRKYRLQQKEKYEQL